MFGHIHIILRDLVVSNFGKARWVEICEAAELTAEQESHAMEAIDHDDKLTISLVAATCKVLNLNLDDALIAFGRHFATFALRSGNARFLKAQGSTLPAFLANVNSLHHQLERDHPNARFPFLESTYHPQSDEVTLTYVTTVRERQGLKGVVIGVVEEIGRCIYGVDVSFESVAVPKEFAAEEAVDRAASWRVSWKPHPGGPVPVKKGKEKSLARAMSAVGLHTAMADFGTLLRMRNELLRPLLCACVLEVKLSPEVARKLALLESTRRPEEDLLLRGTRARHVAAAWADPALPACRAFWESSVGRGADYSLSEDSQQVDVFISHSWSPPENWALVMGEDVDYAEVKSTTLAVMAKDVVAQQQRKMDKWGEVTFWVDKACIPQDHPELKMKCISLLEKFIQRCDHMCVLFTWAYLERLWCVYEWACVLVLKTPDKIWMQTELFMKDDSLPLYLDNVRYFSLARTKCFVESDREILKAKIAETYVSEAAFEELVKATAIALMARSMAFRAGRSLELYRRFFVPWVELAKELGFTDLARALAQGRALDWRKKAAAACTSPVSTPVTSPSSAGKLTLLGRLGCVLGMKADVFHVDLNAWFTEDVAPVLNVLRSKAVKM